MASGFGEICKQHGHRGFFAKAWVQVAPHPFDEIILTESSPWSDGIRFGAAYAIEKIRSHDTNAYQVVVEGFHGMILDTTIMLAALATAEAVWNAFPITLTAQIRRPVPNWENGTVVFA